MPTGRLCICIPGHWVSPYMQKSLDLITKANGTKEGDLWRFEKNQGMPDRVSVHSDSMCLRTGHSDAPLTKRKTAYPFELKYLLSLALS